MTDYSAASRTSTHITLGTDPSALRAYAWTNEQGETCRAVHLSSAVTIHLSSDSVETAERLADLLLRAASEIFNDSAPAAPIEERRTPIKVVPLWQGKRGQS